MAIDARRLLERQFDAVEHRFTQRDAQLYALGVGLGHDPLDGRQLRYLYEGADGTSLQAFPTMVNVLAYPGFWAREPDTGIDWRKLVHAEQHIEIHSPVPTQGCVVGRNRISGLWDKGAGKGALLEQQREVRLAGSDLLLATVTQLSLLRGDGGFGGGGSDRPVPTPHALPVRPADATCDLMTLPQAALIYRLSGDANPLHVDPEVARAAGFERPILHGMAVMGVAANAVLSAVLDYDASRFAAMRVRFTAPVLPGDTLRTEMWVDDLVVSLRTSAIEREVVVLNNAFVRLN